MTMDMKDMVTALVGMPEDGRRKMMTDRLEMFAEMKDADREGAMGQMMEAVGPLPRGDQRKIIKTRTEVLADLPERTRQTLMGTHIKLMMAMPQERMMAEMETIKSIVPELTDRRGAIVMKMMEAMPMPGGNGMGMSHAPASPGAPAALASRRRSWWRFWG